MIAQCGGGSLMLKAVGLVALSILVACGSAQADEPFWDELARYFQRIDTVTVASGDAKDVNAVTHIIDPWPRYAGNRRIPVNGQRMVNAIKRYRTLPKPESGGPTTAMEGQTNISPTSAAGGGGSGGAYGQ